MGISGGGGGGGDERESHTEKERKKEMNRQAKMQRQHWKDGESRRLEQSVLSKLHHFGLVLYCAHNP